MLRTQSGHRAYSDYFRVVPWQLYCTFTFAWPVSDSHAEQVFRAFIDRLEQAFRCPIGWLRGDEKRFSGCGKPGAPRHYHAVLIAGRMLDSNVVANVWLQMAGWGENGAGADVRTYNPSLEGINYLFKFISEPSGNWDFGNLDLFMPPAENKQTNRRERRRLSRQQLRAGTSK